MMSAHSVAQESSKGDTGGGIQEHSRGQTRRDVDVALLTGCRDRHYVYGLVKALVNSNISMDIVGSDEVDCPEYHGTSNLEFLNLGGQQRRKDTFIRKIGRAATFYFRLMRYSAGTKRNVLHILWNYKIEYFDRTFLMLYYKLLGKRIVFTAHNVNAGRRDSNDSLLNRLTLRIQYHFVDHIFVHTEHMKQQLLKEFAVRDKGVTVIPYGINNATPSTDLTPNEAKRRLGIKENEKTMLFFGNIGPYKGLEHLVAAFHEVTIKNQDYRLIIAGKPRSGCEGYVSQIREATRADLDRGRVIQRIEHIPDHEIEVYFKAADVLVLPYTYIFQSGVLFLGYSFGLPVIATDVGSLRDDIIEGETGFVCRPADSADLAITIERYFGSDLFKNLSGRRDEIRRHVNGRHSWDRVGELTKEVYTNIVYSNHLKN